MNIGMNEHINQRARDSALQLRGGAASCRNLYIKKWIRLKCHTAVLKFKNGLSAL
jgi:hypothetical protein